MTKTKKAPKTTERDEKYEALQKIGRCAMSAIAEMVTALECDYDRLEELREARDNEHGDMSITADEAEELAELEDAAGDCKSRDDAEQRIQEDPLSLEFRSGWVTDKKEMEPEEFKLLLTTGGPAVQIIGELDRGEPSHVRLQAQDWFTPWTDYMDQDTAVLETYCRVFYFGD